MNVHVFSSGRFNALTDRLYSGAFHFNTRVFWQTGSTHQVLGQPDRTGNCYLDIGYKIRIKPNHLYILPAVCCYEIISDENMVSNLYYMYLDLYPEIRGDILEINLSESRRCQTLYRALADLIDESQDIITPVATSLFSCPEICRQLTSGKNASILRVVDYINSNYSNQLNNTDLASIASYSLNYFIKAFQQEIGMPPHAYVQSVRLNNAVKMLQNGIPPKEAAVRCGYTNQNIFYRSFKKQFDHPPSYYYKKK